MTQLDLFQPYPQQPGTKRRETSRDAGEELKGRAKTLREKAFQVLKAAARSADEVAAALNESVLTIRPRISELAAQGLIQDSGRRGQSISGKSAIIWEVRCSWK